MRSAVAPDAARSLPSGGPLSTRDTVETCRPSWSAIALSVAGRALATRGPPLDAGADVTAGYTQSFGANVWVEEVSGDRPAHRRTGQPGADRRGPARSAGRGGAAQGQRRARGGGRGPRRRAGGGRRRAPRARHDRLLVREPGRGVRARRARAGRRHRPDVGGV